MRMSNFTFQLLSEAETTFCHTSLMQNCLLFPIVGLKSEIFAFIADNFTVEVLLQNLWTTLYLVEVPSRKGFGRIKGTNPPQH